MAGLYDAFCFKKVADYNGTLPAANSKAPAYSRTILSEEDIVVLE